jgi:ABC-type nitrate/sulfonate/bicarbonate transport system permease component
MGQSSVDQGTTIGGLGRITAKRRQQLVATVLIAVIWEAVGRSSDLGLAPLSRVVVAFVDVFATGEIYGPLSSSLQQLFIGYALAVVVALPIGLMMGWSNSVKYSLDTYVNLMFVTSLSSLLPLLIIFFGTGLQFRVVVVFLFGLFHMILNFQSGVENIDKDLVETGRVFGASPVQLYRHVVIPAALPFIIAGLRLGIGRSFKGMIAAELWILAGIGELLVAYQRFRRIDYAIAVTVLLAILAMVSVQALYWLERRYAPWRSVIE